MPPLRRDPLSVPKTRTESRAYSNTSSDQRSHRRLDLWRLVGHNKPVATLLEELGGEFALRLLINDFIDRVFDDPMIGYHFRAASRERVKEMEFQFAAAHLGGGGKYGGDPIGAAHRKHTIQGGHFDRRLHLLRQVMRDHRCPPAVFDHWVRHTERLRATVVAAEDHCTA